LEITKRERDSSVKNGGERQNKADKIETQLRQELGLLRKLQETTLNEA
jgi:hypothetical protein